MLQPRKFNKITLTDNNLIVKSSFDNIKMEAEYKWLHSSTNIFPHPKVFEYNYDISTGISEYTMEYIPYKSLAEIYIDQLDSSINSTMTQIKYKELFEDIKNKIETNKKHRISTNELERFSDIPDIYRDKTLSRISQTKYKDLSKRYYINFKKLPSLFDIISECSIKTTIDDISYIHGDLCFSNILINPDKTNIEYWTIDPRGIDTTGRISTLGDWRYDVGKLAHSVIGHYDWIKSNKFNLTTENTYNLTFKISPIYDSVRSVFIEVFGQKKIWWQIMVNLFLSMIPLHNDNEWHQEAMFCNALLLYQEMKELFE